MDLLTMFVLFGAGAAAGAIAALRITRTTAADRVRSVIESVMPDDPEGAPLHSVTFSEDGKLIMVSYDTDRLG